MDFNKMGELALECTRQALQIILKEKGRGTLDVRYEVNPYVREGKSPTTRIDILTQRVYTDCFTSKTPDTKIVAEEKDPLLSRCSISKTDAVWVVDGVDGTRNFIDNSFGFGTQCALLLANGTVPIAFVGDGVTGDIFGYYGSSGVFRLAKNGKREPIGATRRRQLLGALGGIHRPSVEQYHPLSQKMLRSGSCGTVRELLGGIGTTMAWLLTDEIGLFALRPHHERPWDAIPAYALCEKAGMVFMTPTKNSRSFEPWRVRHTKETWMRDFDLFVMHESRVGEFLKMTASLQA